MDKKDLKTSLVLFVVLWTVYLLTLANGVTFEDSGELITASWTLSAAHPPGYPLYLLLARLFAFLPFPSPAFRVNFMSAFFSALSGLLFFHILKKTAGEGKAPVYSLLMALSFGLSTTLWSVSLVSEVYSLNIFFVLLLLLLLLMIFQENKTGLHALFFYILGTGAANHQTVLLLFPLYALLFIRADGLRKYSLGFHAKNAFFFFLGASLYFYLPVRALSGPVVNWGDPSNPGRFLEVLFRKQYGSLFSESFSWGSFLNSLSQINPLYEFAGSTGPALRLSDPASLLALVGILYFLYQGFWALKPRTAFLGTGVFLSFTLLLLFFIRTPEDKLFTLKVFFLPGWTGFYMLLFSGIMKVFKKAALVFLATLPALLFALNFGIQNKRQDYYAADYAKNILSGLPYRSVLFTLRDNETFPLWYFTLTEGKRPDLAVINIVLLSESWYRAGLAQRHPGLARSFSPLPATRNKKKLRDLTLGSIIRNHPAGALFFTSRAFGGYTAPLPSLFPQGLLFCPEEKKNPSFSIPEFRNIRNDFALFKKNYYLFSVKDLLPAVPRPDLPARYMLQSVNLSLLDYAENLPEIPSAEIQLFALYLNRLIGTDINNMLILVRLAERELKQNSLNRALDLYEAAAALQPGTAAAGQIKKRAAILKKSSSDRNTDLYQNAETAYSRKEYRKAADLYLGLIRENGENPVLFSGLGDCYFQLKEYKRAMEYYSNAIRIRKDYGTAYYNLGGCHIMLGEKEKAGEIWREGLKHSPGDALLKEALRSR